MRRIDVINPQTEEQKKASRKLIFSVLADATKEQNELLRRASE